MTDILRYQVMPGGDAVAGALSVCASRGLLAVGDPVFDSEETVVIQEMPLVLRNYLIEADARPR